MATVSAKVFEHHKKTDGTYNVKICVHHKDQRKYLDTNHFVVKKQLTKDYKVKDPFIADKVEQQLRDYRKEISELDDRLDFLRLNRYGIIYGTKMRTSISSSFASSILTV